MEHTPEIKGDSTFKTDEHHNLHKYNKEEKSGHLIVAEKALGKT